MCRQRPQSGFLKLSLNLCSSTHSETSEPTRRSMDERTLKRHQVVSLCQPKCSRQSCGKLSTRLKTSSSIMQRTQSIMCSRTTKSLGRIRPSEPPSTSLKEITRFQSICFAMTSSFMLISIGSSETASLNGLISPLSRWTRNLRLQSGTTATTKKTKNTCQCAPSSLTPTSSCN